MIYMQLENNKGFEWQKYKKESLFLKGNMQEKEIEKFMETDFFEAGQMLAHMEKIFNSFACVKLTEKKVWGIVDRVRTIPLFYLETKSDFYISDNPRWILNQTGDKSLNKYSVEEFLVTGYVTKRNIMFSGIKQLLPGEFLYYDDITKELTVNSYYKFKHSSTTKKEDGLIKELDEINEQVFYDLISYLDGRTAIVPLSGGFDSRLIAYMLKRLNYKNVICYTYGIEGNLESKISQEIAESLGYKWIFVPYSDKEWFELINSNEYEKFSEYADNLVSVPHIQDLLAVKKLVDNSGLPSDGVFIPGHTGDFLAGKHIPADIMKQKKIKRRYIVNSLIDRHYSLRYFSLISISLQHKMREKLLSEFEKNKIYSAEEAADEIEHWNWRERQAKFICNSVRVYEFYDFEWYLPLWDFRIQEFWKNAPLEGRLNRNLFFSFFNKIFKDPIPKESSENKVVKLLKFNPLIHDVFMYGNRIKKMNSLYEEHPLNWHKIISKKEYFILSLKNYKNINSILAKKKINEFSKKP